MPQLNFETYNLKNARDLGGTVLQDGSAIKPDLLVRSCALGQANSEEIKQLEANYQLRYVLDLRAAEEAKKLPDPIGLLPNARYFNLPLAADNAVGVVRSGGLREFLALGKRMTEDPVGMMRGMYTDIMLSERGQAVLRKIFDLLLEANGACVLWHCTAGKDRAGIVAAVILLALGASRDTIYDDYLATNNYMAPYLEKQEHQFRFAPKKIKQSLTVLNRADPRYLDAAFEAMESQPDGIEGYLENSLGLDKVKLQELRAIYTEQ